MKYKIFAVFITVFLGISAVMYGVNTTKNAVREFEDRPLSLSLLKDIFLFVKDRDAINSPLRDSYIDLNGAYHGITGKNYVYDIGADITRLKNGYLTNGAVEENAIEGTAELEELEVFQDYLSNNGIDFLYLQVPEKVCRLDDGQLHTGTYSGFGNISNFMQLLSKSDIDYIDFEKEIHDAGYDHYDLFFKTDHHWTTHAGFFAHQKICEKLKNDYGFVFDEQVTNLDNYTQETYEQCFVGSQGSRVGRIYTPVDDFTLIYPKFDTEMTVNTSGEEKSGTFYESVFCFESFSPDVRFGRLNYGVYLNADHDLQIITNHKAVNDKKIVLIKDSFSCVTSPYLALACKELHILDLRHIEDFSAAEYATKIGADIVMVMYNAGGVGLGDFFNPTPSAE